MKKIVLYCEGDELSFIKEKSLQKAFRGLVKTNCNLAFELSFVDEEEIRRLNREYREIDKVTDVLSFPALDNIKGKRISKKDFPFELDENKNLVCGSIAICVKRAKEQAEEYGHSYARELHYLLVHGILHCLGYDHIIDEEKAEMRAKEELVLGKMGIYREEDKEEKEYK